MIGSVNGNGNGVVVDRNVWISIDASAPAAGAAGTGEEVDIKLFLEREGALLGCLVEVLLEAAHARPPSAFSRRWRRSVFAMRSAAIS